VNQIAEQLAEHGRKSEEHMRAGFAAMAAALRPVLDEQARVMRVVAAQISTVLAEARKAK
jgi:hypothetical protein